MTTRKTRPTFLPTLEALEERWVPAGGKSLTAKLDAAGVLTVKGTNKNDNILITQTGNKVKVKGIDQKYKASKITEVVVDGKGGNDMIHLDTLNKKTMVRGGDGNDSIFGGNLADLLFGDNGLDYLYGLNGFDSLNGGDGNDFCYGGLLDDYLYGFGGDDWLDGGFGNDWCYGGFGLDQLFGYGGFDNLFGDDGFDYLYGGDDGDMLDGGFGDDWCYGGYGFDYLYGDSGFDYLFGEWDLDYLFGGLDTDWMDGGYGDDWLYGGYGYDYGYGDYGDDFWDGGYTDDYFDGGFGFDWYGFDGYNLNFNQNTTYTHTMSYNPNVWTVNGATIDDIIQLSSPTCSFLSSMGAVQMTEMNLDDFIQHLNGTNYQVTLYNPRIQDFQNVVVQFDGGYSDFDPQPAANGEYWTILYQRAYLKMLGLSEGQFQGLDPHDALDAVESDPVNATVYNSGGFNSFQEQELISAVAQQRSAVLWTYSSVSNSKLIANHAYTLVNANSQGVVLRNPWGVDGGTLSGANDGYISLSWSEVDSNITAYVTAQAGNP